MPMPETPSLDCGPESYSTDSYHRRLLHVGATRAIQQLWVTCVGVPSAIIDQAIAECSDSD